MDDEAQRTLYCGNLDNRVTEGILYELFLQAGPLEKVKLPEGKPYAFITFKHPISVDYTIKLMDGIRLYNKSVRLQPRSGASTPSRQNSSGGNMNMMQNGMMGNMNVMQNGMMANMPPAMMGHPGIMGQSPFQRSYSAPQFQSTPNSHHQRFQEGADGGGRGRNDSADFRDRGEDRQRERDRYNRDHSRDRDRDRSFDRDRDQGRDRDHSRDRNYGQRDYGRDRGQNRGYGRDRGRDRDWDNNRDRSQERGNNYGGLNRGDTFPLMQGHQQHQQGQLTRQSGFDQDTMAASIDNELRRQRFQQQFQQQQMSPFQQQMQEAKLHNFGRPQHQQGKGQGRYGRRH